MYLCFNIVPLDIFTLTQSMCVSIGEHLMHFHVHRNRICSICDTMMLPSSSSSGHACSALYALKWPFTIRLLTFLLSFVYLVCGWHFIDSAIFGPEQQKDENSGMKDFLIIINVREWKPSEKFNLLKFNESLQNCENLN